MGRRARRAVAEFTDEGGRVVMCISPLKAVVVLTFAVASLGNAAPCRGVSISGVVLYTADDIGNPNGAGTYEGQLQANLWRTALGGEWFILGVWAGLPPESLATPYLNAPDFTVEVALKDGENDFTLVGAPGLLTQTDDYSSYVINVYFDGVLDHPGISVLFPRNGSPGGSPTIPNRSDFSYSLDLNQVQFPAQETYDNGSVSVSVVSASFVPPGLYGADVDLVGPQQLTPDGQSDYIGVLKLNVEASPNSSSTTEGCQAARGARRGSLFLVLPSALLVFVVVRRQRRAQPRRSCAKTSAASNSVRAE